MSEKRDAQREVTRIALSGIAGFGFALAGSGAIREHGVIDRPTEDVDLFTTTRDPVEFVRAIERVSKDLRERGYEVGEVRRATWFARLRVRAADETRLENVESLDFSWTDEGRVMLALDEGRGRRTTARLMSDGILRFSAVTTALMTASTSLDIGGSVAKIQRDDFRSRYLNFFEVTKDSNASQVFSKNALCLLLMEFLPSFQTFSMGFLSGL